MSYEEKYLKYKNKYIELKNMFGGGCTICGKKDHINAECSLKDYFWDHAEALKEEQQHKEQLKTLGEQVEEFKKKGYKDQEEVVRELIEEENRSYKLKKTIRTDRKKEIKLLREMNELKNQEEHTPSPAASVGSSPSAASVSSSLSASPALQVPTSQELAALKKTAAGSAFSDLEDIEELRKKFELKVPAPPNLAALKNSSEVSSPSASPAASAAAGGSRGKVVSGAPLTMLWVDESKNSNTDNQIISEFIERDSDTQNLKVGEYNAYIYNKKLYVFFKDQNHIKAIVFQTTGARRPENIILDDFSTNQEMTTKYTKSIKLQYVLDKVIPFLKDKTEPYNYKTYLDRIILNKENKSGFLGTI